MIHPPTAPATDDAAQPCIAGTVAVRVLCDFAARSGDLDLRFTPSPSGAEGVAGHQMVTARRASGYQRELPLSTVCEGLRVQGRADGWDAAAGRLEEIKTHRGDAALIAPNQRALHWAQARVYGAMLCEQLNLPGLEIALIYFNIDTGTETPLAEWHDAATLREHLQALCRHYRAWALQERAHRAARDAALTTLPFPFTDFRPGQRHLAEAVYRAHKAGRVLMAQAPTGLGKTVATLFAALRAAPAQQTDKVFYLTARTTGRQLALDALQRLGACRAWSAESEKRPQRGQFLPDSQPHSLAMGQEAGGKWTAAADLQPVLSKSGRLPDASSPPGLPLRVIERVARDKACEHPDKACHGDACPLARGFYDRLAAARAEAAQARWLDQTALRHIALAHGVCPYYLGQEMLRWSDVVVGDYNHFFDLGAHWFAQAQEQGWRVGLLVDEAHNLVERARSMHSATLDPAGFQALRREAPEALKKPLSALNRHWNALAREHPVEPPGLSTPLPAPPAALVTALQNACSAMADHLAQHPQAAAGGALQRWFFDALHFQRVAESFGDHSSCDLTPGDVRHEPGARRLRVHQPRVSIRCQVPAPLLADRWAATHGATLFSATLAPMDALADLLGLPANTARADVPSPFSSAQLRVRVATQLSTRWSDRAASLTPMVRLMAAQFKAQPGNYLAFFSSFDYLQQAQDRLREEHPALPVWAQSRGMSEPERAAFLARFTEGGEGIGFAVLGGAFSEGIDLPGRRLIGAFIATLGMSQINPVNERLRARLQAWFGQGFEYAYLYPGLQKVAQAAGRVIRSEADRGTVWLLDDRFARPEVRQHLPAWWGLGEAGD